jgi:hypothetical protein
MSPTVDEGADRQAHAALVTDIAAAGTFALSTLVNHSINRGILSRFDRAQSHGDHAW